MRAIVLCAFVGVLFVNTEVFGINPNVFNTLVGYSGAGGSSGTASSEYGSFKTQLAYGLRRLETEQKQKFTLTSIEKVSEQVVAGTIWNADVVFEEGNGTVKIVEQLNGKLEEFKLTIGDKEYTVGRDQ